MDELGRSTKRSGAEPGSDPGGVPTVPLGVVKEAGDDFHRAGKRPRLDGPLPMTAAIAMTEARAHSKSPPSGPAPSPKTSPHPATQVVSALTGTAQHAVSKAPNTNGTSSSADPATAVSEELAAAIANLPPPHVADPRPLREAPAHTSPASTLSYDGPDSVPATAGGEAITASPRALHTSPQPRARPVAPDAASPGTTAKAFSYSTPLLQPQPTDGRRGMSLPHANIRHNTRSPSSRRHQCPFCSTEFTRQHNLKSHLLTHSQEKPYVCSTCSSRFRRLHDLKRHTKLHTGERPHVCPKCHRKFARGDALARHNKGPGGCAGRRASLGSFGGDDDLDGEDAMDGVMYGEPESMDDGEDGAGKAPPSIRRQAPSGDDAMDDGDQYSRIPSTYPPIQGRPAGGIASGQFPPRPAYVPAPGPAPLPPAHLAGGPVPPLHPSAGPPASLRPAPAGSVFAQNPLTESPKAISPGRSQRGSGPTEHRLRSPSGTHYPPAPTFGRAMSGSGPGLASPAAGPQLPPPPGLNPPDPRYTLVSQGGPAHPPTQPSGPPTHMSGSGPRSSHSNSLSSHGQSGPSSGDHVTAMFNKEDRLWAYVKDLESRVNAMQHEIESLKSQLAAAAPVRP